MPASDSVDRTHSVGSYLRENRESRGISLEDAARVTRIGKYYLASLEAGEYDALPNAAYVKGFLRAYAAFLGLSGDELIAMYERETSPPPQHPAEERTAPDAAGVRRREASRRSRWAVPFVLLVLVLAAAYLIGEKGPEQGKAPAEIEAVPALQVAAPLLPPRSSAQTVAMPAESPADGGKAEPVPISVDRPGEGVVLKLKVNQDSWLHITIDDAVSQQYDLKAGDLIEWKGDRTFTLDLGNAGGIEAEFNGKPMKPFGEPGKPAHIVLKGD